MVSKASRMVSSNIIPDTAYVVWPEPLIRNPYELGKHEAPLTPWELAALQESAGQTAVGGALTKGGQNA